VRALHPFSPEDHALLEAVNRGEFAINGLRNRDLQTLLPGPKVSLSAAEKRRRSARMSRQLRMLRAHGLIQKVPRNPSLSSHHRGPARHHRNPHCGSRQPLPTQPDRRLKNRRG
jgi:hypothetical protein